MTGYKAYNKGMVCKGFQYKEGEIYEEEKAIPCECGFHYCHEPFDVWDYYDMFDQNGDFTEYSTVEPQAEEHTDDNKKFCTTKIKIGAKLSFAGFIKAGIDVLIEKTKEIKDGLSDKGKDSAQIGSSGGYAQIGSSGYSARIGSSGYSARIGSSGDSAQIGSSGYYARIASEGEDSVICCAGIGATARAKKGSWITLSEWKYDEEKERYVPICVKTEQVDGERIKEDTFYRIEGGEFVEVK